MEQIKYIAQIKLVNEMMPKIIFHLQTEWKGNKKNNDYKNFLNNIEKAEVLPYIFDDEKLDFGGDNFNIELTGKDALVKLTFKDNNKVPDDKEKHIFKMVLMGMILNMTERYIY